jgi:integrase
MADSIGKSPARKPAKPYEGFPLFPHASGRWAKKIRGRLHYFGPWRDWQGAFERYEREIPYLLQGKTPPAESTGALEVGDLVNLFLEQRLTLIDSGELKRQTWLDYKAIGVVLVKQLGRHTSVESLTPSDFADLRKHFAQGRGLVSLKNSIARSMAFFNYAYGERLIKHPVDTGGSFAKPKKVALKREKLARGSKSFTLDELTLLYKAANPQMRCFMLLGLNAGLGNGDIGQLQRHHITGNWVNYPRPKTLVDRRFPLWGVTLEAIEATRQTSHPDSPYVFLTKRGLPWFKDNGDDPLSKEFRKLQVQCGLHRKHRGFYSLRHQFRSICRGCNDREAVDAIMGHADGTVAENYMEWAIEDSRLQAVVDFVYRWLTPMFEQAAQDGGEA